MGKAGAYPCQFIPQARAEVTGSDEDASLHCRRVYIFKKLSTPVRGLDDVRSLNNEWAASIS